ncbi:hypothetical protein FQA47_018344 [Oryzias melastigma]|uniref:Uncharacterized protein n=1 Tax=Oryzias melastigma TaxID=30732 RepID=A0A834BUL0_ORYME|nr:hypothetical protein FQA47_018344 [Oryzias melastigma]
MSTFGPQTLEKSVQARPPSPSGPPLLSTRVLSPDRSNVDRTSTHVATQTEQSFPQRNYRFWGDDLFGWERNKWEKGRYQAQRDVSYVSEDNITRWITHRQYTARRFRGFDARRDHDPDDTVISAPVTVILLCWSYGERGDQLMMKTLLQNTLATISCPTASTTWTTLPGAETGIPWTYN